MTSKPEIHNEEESAAGGESCPLPAEATADSAISPDQTRIAVLEEQNAKLKDQMLRAVAETENIRKRAQREREDAAKFSIGGFAKDLLSVADNLRRALDAIPVDLTQTDARVKNLIDGIEATQREMHKTFEKNGIRRVDPAIGEPFNANFHEVIFEAPGTGRPAGTIIQVAEVGYVLNDRLLRPARVGVAKDDAGGSPVSGGHLDTQA